MHKTDNLSVEQNKILEEEQQLLLKVKQGLLMHTAEEKKGEISKSQLENIIELRDSLSEILPEDVPAVMSQMESMVLLHSQQDSHNIDKNFNLDTPYFAHIRLRENNRERDLLIGNQNCFSKHLPCSIVDWKNAPISQIFYRYREGEEYVEDIGEREIEGELLTRRMLLIENGILMRINWPGGILENISTDSKNSSKWHLIAHKIPRLESGKEKIIDDVQLSFEQENSTIVTPKKKFSGYSVDKHLRQITALVDPQQFKIITHSESGIVLIQGGAGSGKTTVALHRLAYLISNNPQYYKPKTVLPIVFGPALANYMSKVLPALGVHGVRPRTYHKWVSGLRRRALPDLPGNYAENTPMDVIELKRHPLWLEYYREEVQKRTNNYRELLEDKLSKIEGLELVLKACDSMKEVPLIPRLIRLLRWSKGELLLNNIPKLSSIRMEKQLENQLDQAFPELQKNPYILTTQIWNDCLVRKELLFETVERLAPGEFSETQLTSVCTWAVRQYQKRQELEEALENEKGNGHHLDEQKDLEADNFNFMDDKSYLDEEDDTLLLLLFQLLMGPIKRKNGSQLLYTHLMLDEAQDFGALEFQLLVSLTPANRISVTLAGDLDQRIMHGRKNETWEESLAHLTLPDGSKPDVTALEPLKIGYRSTNEIMVAAKNVIGDHTSNIEWHSTRHGAPVDVFRFKQRGAMIAFLAETLKDFSIREPLASVAVLTRTPETAEFIYEGLKLTDLANYRIIKEQEFTFTPGLIKTFSAV